MIESSYRFFLVSTVTVLLLMQTASGYADPASQIKVLEGRALLFDNGNFSTAGLISAKAKFAEAVSIDPEDSEALLFLSITRLPALMDGALSYTEGLPIENFREFFDRLGLDTTGRDIFNWTASFSRDENGDTILPTDMPALQEFLNVIRIECLQEVDNALSDLEHISNHFSIILNSLEIGSDYDVEVDYGDVLLYKTGLYTLKTFLHIILSYDMNLDDFDQLFTKIDYGIFNVNDDLLNSYPQFLNLLTDGAFSIASARNSVLLAIDTYGQASDFIKNELDSQDNDLFVLDFESRDSELDFLADLQQIKSSLVDRGSVSIDEKPEVNFSQFFDDPIDIRNYLPVFEYDPFITSEMLSIDICTVSDKTFSGIFPKGIAGCTLPGDVDHTGQLDLKDTILALKISAGMNETSFSDADINKDGKIGIEEVIYLLQRLMD